MIELWGGCEEEVSKLHISLTLSILLRVCTVKFILILMALSILYGLIVIEPVEKETSKFVS